MRWIMWILRSTPCDLVHALDHVDIEVNTGDFVAVMGPSGSGKSTLMNILGCLDRPDAGEYRLLDKLVSNMPDDELSGLRNRYIGFVFQSYHLLPRMTALENVLLPLRYAKGWVEEGSSRARLSGTGTAEESGAFEPDVPPAQSIIGWAASASGNRAGTDSQSSFITG